MNKAQMYLYCLRKHHLIRATSVAFLLTFLSFAWQGHKGFSLWDEGYLWYGVQRVLVGEVPIKDFMAYDPGRYYWAAAFLSFFHAPGIMHLRASVALFQALGLSVGLFLILQSMPRRDSLSPLFTYACAIILLIWMFPRHKLFDLSLSIFQIGVLSHLVSRPVNSRFVFAGIGVGIAFIFGRNHGLYGAVASVGLICFLTSKNSYGPGFLSALLRWCTGFLIGLSPLILIAYFSPGFATAFWNSFILLFEQRATNLPLPVPWPWTVDFTLPLVQQLRHCLTGCFFISTFTFGVIAVGFAVVQRRRGSAIPATVVAAGFLSVPYSHYAFSRADVGHLAHGIFPLLIGTLILAAHRGPILRWVLTALLGVASWSVIGIAHPGWRFLVDQNGVEVAVSNQRLLVDANTAADILLLRDLKARLAPDKNVLVVTPTWPGAYSLLGQKSPIWEIYALLPRSPEFELQEIERIQSADPALILIHDLALDGRDELRYQNTHPLIYRYIEESYDLMTTSPKPEYLIFTKRHLR